MEYEMDSYLASQAEQEEIYDYDSYYEYWDGSFSSDEYILELIESNQGEY